jgi:hypothetical protein
MSPKTATSNLYVAVVTLLTGIIALVHGVIRLTLHLIDLVSGLLSVAIHWLNPGPAKAKAPEACQRPNLRIVSTSPAAAEQLTKGLCGMGFRAPEVRAFVEGLGDKIDNTPMPDLIKLGLAALGRKTA